MNFSARVAALVISALLLSGAALPARAQDKGRPYPKAAAPVDEKSAAIDESLRLSGVRNHVAALRERLTRALENDYRADFDIRRWATRMLASSFSAESCSKSVRQALLDNYNADIMARVLTWYRSGTGRKMVRLEQSGAEPGQSVARRTYLATLENKQPSEKRLVLIFRIDESLRASEDAFATIKAVAIGWSRVVEDLQGERDRTEVIQLETALAIYRAQARDEVGEDVLREMMYTYRDATDAELGAYAEFLDSDAGQWFFGTVDKGFRTFLDKAADRMAQDYINSVITKKPTGPPSASAPPAPTAPPTKK
jgi:hypothetical protein